MTKKPKPHGLAQALRGAALGAGLLTATAILALSCSVQPAVAEEAKDSKTDMRGSHSGDEVKGGAEVDHSKMNHSGHGGHYDHKMTLDDGGMTMNWNDDTLPRGCKEISEEVDIEVRAGRKYANAGQAFGFDKNEWRVKPCAKVTVNFINEDDVRHQWMMHGLPRYLYDQGMFHLEAAGNSKRKASLIVPNDDVTYLVHCDISQHMEKGLKAQLKVGAGSGDLPSVPGISDARIGDLAGEPTSGWQTALLLAGLIFGVGIGSGVLRRASK